MPVCRRDGEVRDRVLTVEVLRRGVVTAGAALPIWPQADSLQPLPTLLLGLLDGCDFGDFVFGQAEVGGADDALDLLR